MEYTVEDMRYCLQMAVLFAGGKMKDIPKSVEAIAWWNIYCRIGNHYQVGGKKYRSIKRKS
jgi:hypothetical protein